MIFKIAWRNIYRNKKRSLITITSVFAALLLIILMRALQFGFYDKLIETVVESYAGYVEIHADGFWDNQSLDNSMQVDQQLLDDIQSVEGVENIVQRLQTFSLISVGEKTKGGVINGINLSEEQKITDWNKKMVSGSFDLSDNEIIIAKGIAEFFDISEDDTLILYGQGYRGMMAAGKYPVKGVIDLKNPDPTGSTNYGKLRNASLVLTPSTSAINNYTKGFGPWRVFVSAISQNVIRISNGALGFPVL